MAIASSRGSTTHKTLLWLSRKDQSLTSASEKLQSWFCPLPHQPGASGNPFGLCRACVPIWEVEMLHSS